MIGEHLWENNMTLRDVVARLREERVDLTDGYLGLLQTAADWWERRYGPVDVTELCPAMLRQMLRDLKTIGRTPRTANNYRQRILLLWREARRDGAPALPERGQCPKLREPDRLPTAWTPQEIGRIVAACRQVQIRRGWGPAHWEALVMTIYDTGLRIGCLMRSEVDQLDVAAGLLYVPGELQKGRRDTFHPVHERTASMLANLPRNQSVRLFPWPFHPDELWRKFKRDVLRAAGLPATRRDQFHRIRRTSYTLVYVQHGLRAAMEHASHTEDLSRLYLDPRFLTRPNPLDALPRPA